MATRKLEEMGARGEALVANLVGVKPTTKKAPFDGVDFNARIAYEVKTTSVMALNGSDKIRISDKAWDRKQAFLSEYGLTGVLIVVVVYSIDYVEVYRLPLDRKHLRISRAVREGVRVA
tara:strand:+ start:175 stop:531 length:357 start_codon:yes stop_codon:yes gene_type:complete